MAEQRAPKKSLKRTRGGNCRRPGHASMTLVAGKAASRCDSVRTASTLSSQPLAKWHHPVPNSQAHDPQIPTNPEYETEYHKP